MVALPPPGDSGDDSCSEHASVMVRDGLVRGTDDMLLLSQQEATGTFLVGRREQKSSRSLPTSEPIADDSMCAVDDDSAYT